MEEEDRVPQALLGELPLGCLKHRLQSCVLDDVNAGELGVQGGGKPQVVGLCKPELQTELIFFQNPGGENPPQSEGLLVLDGWGENVEEEDGLAVDWALDKVSRANLVAELLNVTNMADIYASVVN